MPLICSYRMGRCGLRNSELLRYCVATEDLNGRPVGGRVGGRGTVFVAEAARNG
jgi:hypothetical protein